MEHVTPRTARNIPRAVAASALLFTLNASSQDISCTSPGADQPVNAEVDPALWDRVSDIARRAKLGARVLREGWPGGGGMGIHSLSPLATIGQSEIRQRQDDTVAIAYMDITGRCISHSEVLARYPRLELTQAPRPHGPPGMTATVWSAFGEWGEIMFTFTGGRPDCLDRISFDPRPVPAEN